MGHYISVIPLGSPLDLDGLRRLHRVACLDLYGVTWLKSFLATDGDRMVSWYDAPDAERVRFVLRQQKVAEAAVWRAEVGGAADVRQLVEGRELVCIESEHSTPTVVEGLEADHRVARLFIADRGGRLVCLVKTHDTPAVVGSLQAAGIAASAVWPCVELDPRPPELFEASTPPVRSDGAPGGPVADAPRDVLDAVIIGAGPSGICALERMLRLGMRVRLYEAGSDVGGVWHWNRYPGARMDSEAYTYGFSFSQDVLREWQWRELFAGQPETESYLRFVVDRLDLRRHMRFEARVAAAHYDESSGRWQLETHAGERVAARYLVAAAGTLSTPLWPEDPGVDDFAGESYHTARWPSTGVELAGRRVGVIGTGASGVQVIQTIASQVEQLIVFRRTPTYCIPQRNRELTHDDRREIERNWSEILAACNNSYAGFIHDFDPRPGLTVSKEEREARFEALWQTPGFAFWLANFGDLLMNDDVNEHASDFVRRKIRACVHDQEVARRLLPDHPFGCKRVPLENGYYEAFNRANVRLVDLRETPIERVTGAGIQTSREEHALDVIVYATGFDAGTGPLTRIDIRGEGGRTLADKWRQGPKTYLGLLVSGFPNLFIVNGPQNAAALCNAGRCIEQNVDWIAGCISYLRARGFTRIVPTVAAEREWTQHVEDVADSTVLRRMKSSWFFGANTPKTPRRAGIYAAGARLYRKECESVAQAGYAGCALS